MLIQSDLKYKDELIKLWQEVFGDEKAYVELLFEKVFSRAKCFAVLEKENIVSCLYLLPNKLSFNGEIFSGLYLYAAATKMSHRNKGLMAELIAQAQQYAKENKFDYISLVPANEQLYEYYQKFSFETAMHKVVSTNIAQSQNDICSKYKALSAKEIEQIRKGLKINHFIWEYDELEYALKCLDFYGTEFYGNNDVYFLYNKQENIIRELMFKSSETKIDLQDIKINSPYNLDGFENKMEKFGMIFPINRSLSRKYLFKDIYMNLALD